MQLKELNDHQVTVQAGISIGSLGKQRRGARGLSISSVAKILNTYTDLNAAWLITGKGTRLLSETPPETAYTTSELKEKIRDLEVEVKGLYIELKNINRDMGKKEAEIEFLKALILEKSPNLYQSLYLSNTNTKETERTQ
jgi:hypothetical protein